jgi:CubicO group peptidase (beta-lactamase class C family)
MKKKSTFSNLFLTALLMINTVALGDSTKKYSHADEPIGSVREVYDGALYPDIAANTFRNIDRLFPTRAVRRGNNSQPLPTSTRQLQNFTFESGDETYDLYDYLATGRVSGLLVIKQGSIAFEKYFLGNDENTRWMSMSVVKSITAMLVGAAIKDGHIDSIDDQVTKYLPQLIGSAYEGVTVKHLLQMASGVKWNETYTDVSSDRRAMLEAQISQQPGAILALMASLPRVAEPGTRYNYSTGETQVVGALVAAVTGTTVSDYLSQKIWAKAGMESDATWWLEAPDGLEVGGSGLSATLRDYGRFGLFLLNNGVVNGESVLPEGWVTTASTPQVINGKAVGYGYMLWPMPNNAYAAIGIFGQFIYVRPERELVVVMWSATPKPDDRSLVVYDFLDALGDAVP